MSKRRDLRDIDERKRLLVAKADLQRSTFMMLASPVFSAVQAVELGLFAVRAGRAVARRIKR